MNRMIVHSLCKKTRLHMLCCSRHNLLVMVMALILLLGSCGRTIPPSDQITVPVPQAFKWFVVYDWFSPPNAWGSDPVSGWIKENKHVDIEWISPSGASAQKLQLMIVTGDLPELVTLDRGTMVNKFIESGLLLSFDEYLDKMPNFRKWAGELNLSLLRHTDGKLYQLPNWYISPDATSGNGGAGWAVNSEIYEELGRPPLETFDDLERYLMLVKENKPGIIPLEACDNFQVIELVHRGQAESLANFLPNILGRPESDRFTPVFQDSTVREAIVYLARLFRNKLVTQDAFTQTRDQVIEKLANGQVAVVATWDFGGIVKKGNDLNRTNNQLYEAIWPPVKIGVDPEKVTLSGYTTLGWNVVVATKKAEGKLERIVEYLDWATGPEGQRVLCYGPEGYFWDQLDENGIPIWNDKYAKATMAERDTARLFNWNWVGNTTWVDIGKVAANNRLPPEQRDRTIEIQGNILWKTTREENEFAYDKPAPDSDLGMIETQLRDLYEEALAFAMFAKSDSQVLEVLDSIQTEMDRVGYAQYLDFHSKAWQDRKKLLASFNNRT